MQVVQVHEFGGPDVLVPGELPDLVAGAGEVVVDLAVTDVLFIDTLLRAGWGQDYFPQDLPYVPGRGGAGTVVSAGAGVDPRWLGRRVVASVSSSYAAQVVASVDDVVPVPDGLSLEDAAAVMHDGRTAIDIAEAARVRPGERVLVTAAAGGAASIVVQLAQQAGGRVLAAARRRAKLDHVLSLGVDDAIDYSEDGWVERVRSATGGRGADVVIDGVGGKLGGEAFEATADGGRFFTYGSSTGAFADVDPEVAERRGVEAVNLLEQGAPDPETGRALIVQALDLAAAGKIRPHVGASYPLAQAAQAHAAIAARSVIGKSLLVA